MFKSGNLTVMVSNMDEAVKFYTEKLGMALKSRQGDHWAEVQVPGLTIGLHPGGQAGASAEGQPKISIGLEVDNLDREVERLKAKGVEFAPGLSDAATRLIYFSDPDQTPLYLFESRKAAEGTKQAQERKGSSKSQHHLGAIEEDMIHIQPPVVSWPGAVDSGEAKKEKGESSKELTPG
jgi:catechol 2,3-dioxygenase-like lactoylglutathione lyase family enzyme